MDLLISAETNSNMTIRTCTVDGGSKTNDVELIRTGNKNLIKSKTKIDNVFSMNLLRKQIFTTPKLQ